MKRTRSTALLTALALVALATGACGGSSNTSGSGGSGGSGGTQQTGSAPVTAAKDPTLAAAVPSALAAKGTLTVGTDASYAPNEFLDTDGTTVIGFDADLAQALGQVLGLRVQVQNAPFGTLIEGIKGGKYDLGLSSFTINPERVAQINMVSYYRAGTSWAVPAGNPDKITPDDACGRKIAVQKDTTQVPDVTARSQACVKAGKPAVTIEQFPLQSDVTSAVVSGKDDALLADSPIVAYAVKQTGGKLEVVGTTYDTAPYGIAVPKSSPQLAKAVQGAAQKLMDDGQYRAILQHWGVQDGAVTKAELNPTVR